MLHTFLENYIIIHSKSFIYGIQLGLLFAANRDHRSKLHYSAEKQISAIFIMSGRSVKPDKTVVDMYLNT